MEILFILLGIALYPYFKSALKEVIIDTTWLLTRPVKWTIKLYKKIKNKISSVK